MSVFRKLIPFVLLTSIVVSIVISPLLSQKTHAQGNIDTNAKVYHYNLGSDYVEILDPKAPDGKRYLKLKNVTLIGGRPGQITETRGSRDPEDTPEYDEDSGLTQTNYNDTVARAYAASQDATARYNELRGILRRGTNADGSVLRDDQLLLLDGLLGEAAKQEDLARNAAKLAQDAFEEGDLAGAQRWTNDAIAKQGLTTSAVQNSQQVTGRDPRADGSGAQSADDNKCSIWNITQCAKDILAFLVTQLLKLAALFLYFGGMTLDYAINYTIVNLKSSLDGIPAINVTWETFRDFANMFFIFILLYAGIGTILGLSNVNRKQIITRIVIVALFINFSLFATKVFIDATNALAVGIYQEILKDPETGLSENKNVSYVIMDNLKLTTLYQNKGAVTLFANSDPLESIIAIGIGGSVFFVVTAITFFFAAIILLYRFVWLIILMMFSALAFASFAIPRFNKASDWWGRLFSEAVFAPVWMLFLYAVIKVTQGLGSYFTQTQDANGNTVFNFAELFKNPTSDIDGFGIVASFVIIIILISGGTLIAKSMGLKGGNMAQKLTKRLQGYVGNATFGVAGFAGRRVIGGTASAIASSAFVKQLGEGKGRFSALTNPLGRIARRGIIAGADKASSATYDVRNSAIAKDLGLQDVVGKGQGKGGYKEYLKKKEKAAVDYADKIKLSERQQERKQQREERRALRLENKAKANLEKVEKANKSKIDENIKAVKEKVQTQTELERIMKEAGVVSIEDAEKQIKDAEEILDFNNSPRDPEKAARLRSVVDQMQDLKNKVAAAERRINTSDPSKDYQLKTARKELAEAMRRRMDITGVNKDNRSSYQDAFDRDIGGFDPRYREINEQLALSRERYNTARTNEDRNAIRQQQEALRVELTKRRGELAKELFAKPGEEDKYEDVFRDREGNAKEIERMRIEEYADFLTHGQTKFARVARMTGGMLAGAAVGMLAGPIGGAAGAAAGAFAGSTTGGLGGYVTAGGIADAYSRAAKKVRDTKAGKKKGGAKKGDKDSVKDKTKSIRDTIEENEDLDDETKEELLDKIKDVDENLDEGK
jgi:hypothetical protein